MSNEIVVYESTNVGNYGIVERDTNDNGIVAMWIAQSNSENTRQQYARVAATFFAHTGKPLQAVTLSDLQSWQSSLSGKPNTNKLSVNAVKSLFSFAQKTGYIALNPAVMLKAEKSVETKHTKTLTEEQVIRLASGNLGKRDEAIVRVLYSSAMRVSELCNLQWKDVVEAGNKAILVIRGKGGKTRESGISASAYSAMKALRNGASDESFVFLSNRKQQMDRTTVNHLFTKLSAIVGKDISPHWLRHSHVTHALQRGANPTDVMNQAGHSSLAVTTTYAHSEKFSSDVLAM